MYVHSVMPALRGNAGVGYYPFLSMQRALRSLDGVFTSTAEAAAMPIRIDVKEDDKAYHVSAELPGLSEKEVEVTFGEGVLAISGEKKVERDEKKDTWHIIERAQGGFTRQLSLGDGIDASKVEARFDKGVLTVMLPKQSREQPSSRKIEVGTS
jgi:HSP20 family protein